MKAEQKPENSEDQVTVESETEKAPELPQWYDTKQTGEVLLMVVAQNLKKEKTKMDVTIKSDSKNVRCPLGAVRETLYDNESKCLMHLCKINPTLDWGNLEIEIKTKLEGKQPSAA